MQTSMSAAENYKQYSVLLCLELSSTRHVEDPSSLDVTETLKQDVLGSVSSLALQDMQTQIASPHADAQHEALQACQCEV